MQFRRVKLRLDRPDDFTEDTGPPSLRQQPQRRLLEAVRKQGRRGFVHAGRREALLLGANGIEIDEPQT